MTATKKAAAKAGEAAAMGLDPVKIMTRRIGQVAQGNVVTAQQVEMELAVWYAQGYRLFASHFLGLAPGEIMLSFILEKRPE
jgi:hypothetical protein